MTREFYTDTESSLTLYSYDQ